MKKSLVLTGMMGVGKSTIGSKVAVDLKFKFIDIDSLIEKTEKITISKIFKSKGETYFRNLERSITLNTLNTKQAVISLGGGSFIDPTVRKEVLNTSISIWLDLSINELIKRNINSKKRPLLDSNEDLKKSIERIYNDRKSIYNLSNYRVKCDDLSEQIIVKKVLSIYENN